MNKKSILAYDCAGFGASFALKTADGIVDGTIAQTQQAAELIPAIDVFMHEAGLAYGDLACIVTTVGPGSFTGVRIGLAALHGLALATLAPVKTITTLEAIAWDVSQRPQQPQSFYVALKAGKGEIYTQRFELQAGKPVATGEITLLPENHATWDAPCFGNQLPIEDAHYIAGPRAEILCAIADALPTTALADAVPLYIRPPDAIAKNPHPWITSN